MTYLTPRNWWLRPFHFLAQCQNATIEEQYEKYDVRLFDIRVKYNTKENIWEFAHGMMTFKGKTPKEVFDWLNAKDEKIYIRLILEYNKPNNDIQWISEYFVNQVKNWIKEYPNLVFFELVRKYDWKQLYSYEGMPHFDIYQACSSSTWNALDDWWPWLYAHMNNADNKRQGTDKEFLLMDFVGMW